MHPKQLLQDPGSNVRQEGVSMTPIIYEFGVNISISNTINIDLKVQLQSKPHYLGISRTIIHRLIGYWVALMSWHLLDLITTCNLACTVAYYLKYT